MSSRGKKIVSLVSQNTSQSQNTQIKTNKEFQIGDIVELGTDCNVLNIDNIIVEGNSNNSLFNNHNIIIERMDSTDILDYDGISFNDAGPTQLTRSSTNQDTILFEEVLSTSFTNTAPEQLPEFPRNHNTILFEETVGDNTVHNKDTFTENAPGPSTGFSKKIVDYDSSSSSDTQASNKNKSIQPRWRRHSSDVSFHDAHEIPSDTESTSDDIEQQLVGTTRRNKKSKMPKRKFNRLEKNYGKGKELQPNPCKENCPNQCSLKFPEVVRQDIHEMYWGLGTFQRQRDWLLSCIREVGIKRRRQEAETSRRQASYKYVIPWENVEHQVCQKFLLQTLDISQMTLRYTKNNAISCRVSKSDQRGRHEPANKTSLELKKHAIDFISTLPAVPSHYCRVKTSRNYLPSEFRNMSRLYQIFKSDQINNGKNIQVSFKVFTEIFKKEFNIGFHVPKKDKCGMCESRKEKDYEETDQSRQEYEKHLRLKDICKEEFLTNQKKGVDDKGFLCVSFDLQKVLNTPHGDNLLLYYARKYSFYNLTIYENVTQNGLCYLWGECDGNRGSNEICTTLYKYLHDVDKKGIVQNVSLHCDSCSGQNKNRSTLAMLFYFLNESSNIKTIKITFLLPGHTYMPVDSIHGTIERFIKRRTVWAPSEWETIIGNSRINPRNLETVKLYFSDFLDWKQLSGEILSTKKFKSIDGESIKITQVRSAYFEKNNSNVILDYSYNSENLKTIKITLPKKWKNMKIKKLYTKNLSISSQKQKDLQDLCKKNVIPRKYHQEYLNMKPSENVPDKLPETDLEDDMEELEN